ncbi:MAG TPA: hypothetical protein VGK67_14420 [Myxococcales bacterium]|jgi:hypothetical protein
MAQTSTKGRLARRVSASGLACALVLLQFFGLAHYFLVSHEICPEHGESLHAHKGAGSLSPALAQVAHPAIAGSNAEGPGEFDHEHCSVFLRRRNPALPGPTLGIAEPQAAATFEIVAAARDASVSVAVLFFAPKGSPPLG